MKALLSSIAIVSVLAAQRLPPDPFTKPKISWNVELTKAEQRLRVWIDTRELERGVKLLSVEVWAKNASHATLSFTDNDHDALIRGSIYERDFVGPRYGSLNAEMLQLKYKVVVVGMWFKEIPNFERACCNALDMPKTFRITVLPPVVE